MTQVFFSNIRQEILAAIETANSEINIAVCWFTNKALFESVCEKLRKNIKVNLIVLNDGINNRIDGLDFQRFINMGGTFFFSNVEKPVHDKYCIIDRKLLINGSYNWTYFAENNYENITIIIDEDVIDAFYQDFERLKSETLHVTNVSEVANKLITQMTIVETFSNIDNFILKENLGEKVYGDKFSIIIPKNTKIPFTSNTIRFTTVEDNQESCEIDIRCGDNQVGSKNEFIGNFTVRSIPAKPKSMINIMTTFSIDKYFILTVTKLISETRMQTTKQFNIKKFINCH